MEEWTRLKSSLPRIASLCFVCDGLTDTDMTRAEPGIFFGGEGEVGKVHKTLKESRALRRWRSARGAGAGGVCSGSLHRDLGTSPSGVWGGAQTSAKGFKKIWSPGFGGMGQPPPPWYAPDGYGATVKQPKGQMNHIPNLLLLCLLVVYNISPRLLQLNFF